MKITQAAIASFEKRYRAAFVNSITGFKSVSLIGTRSKDGLENLALFSQIFHLGASPALIGMIIRPHSTPRHTLENIIETNYYTINHISEDIYEQAHHTSARYDRDISEFKASGLNPLYENDFFAPYVKESSIRIGLKKEEITTLNINNTVLVIGSIQQVYLPNDQIVAQDGFVDLEKVGTITCSGLDSYHKTERIKRLPYAKPKG